MRRLSAVPLAVAVVAATGAVAVGQSTDTTQPQGSSVGDGVGPAPSISSSVRKAASRGRCSVRSFASEGVQHGVVASAAQTPPVSGTHAPRWADWGVYDRAVPFAYQVHNLEHGGVVIHLGRRISDGGLDGLAGMYAAEPGYLIVTPAASNALAPAAPGLRAFPAKGMVATSWQRRLVCKKATKRSVKAVRTFVRAYRGAGPEQLGSFNSIQPRPADLPAPTLRMPER